ncbi:MULTISPECIES: RNA polymerase sigma factor [Streptomyces]|uniref:RNA polymerase sigma factor n=1 Tax=Streptomyces TaxID=1883 RepID=UPI0029A1A0B3|nr:MULTISPECIES: RNA polymerase sigma factor [Streptomyces]MDX3067762.1 RNA polymerase sigma factor [Streptomyces sp. ND04-05B]MDX3519399.1 RNA polymerase sigma factor [Streptomyces scabiei]
MHNLSRMVLGLDQVEVDEHLAGVPVVDEAMLAAFYDTHVDKLFKFLARRAGQDDGGEILSQVFEEFFAWWPEHPAHAKPVATLYRIARCRLNDYLRRSGRVETLDADDLAAAADGAHRDELADIVRRADLRIALRELTERERQALGLRYVADLPVKECAEVMDVGIDNMKKILKTALNKLRLSPRMEGYQIITTAKEARQ